MTAGTSHYYRHGNPFVGMFFIFLYKEMKDEEKQTSESFRVLFLNIL